MSWHKKQKVIQPSGDGRTKANSKSLLKREITVRYKENAKQEIYTASCLSNKPITYFTVPHLLYEPYPNQRNQALHICFVLDQNMQ